MPKDGALAVTRTVNVMLQHTQLPVITQEMSQPRRKPEKALARESHAGYRGGPGQHGLSTWLALPNQQDLPVGSRVQAVLAPAPSVLHTFPIETRLGCIL